jgi:hypothetical protein
MLIFGFSSFTVQNHLVSLSFKMAALDGAQLKLQRTVGQFVSSVPEDGL